MRFGAAVLRKGVGELTRVKRALARWVCRNPGERRRSNEPREYRAEHSHFDVQAVLS